MLLFWVLDLSILRKTIYQLPHFQGSLWVLLQILKLNPCALAALWETIFALYELLGSIPGYLDPCKFETLRWGFLWRRHYCTGQCSSYSKTPPWTMLTLEGQGMGRVASVWYLCPSLSALHWPPRWRAASSWWLVLSPPSLHHCGPALESWLEKLYLYPRKESDAFTYCS